MGSGKTTMARRIEKEKDAVFFTLDGIIKSFNQPIKNIKDYESHMAKAHDIMISGASAALRSGKNVVFDIGGPWPRVKDLANSLDVKIEIYHFDISPEVRWQRVQKRNNEKPVGVYHFTMYKDEFDSQDPKREPPALEPGLKIIKITE